MPAIDFAESPLNRLEERGRLRQQPVLALAQPDVQPVESVHGVPAGVRLHLDPFALRDHDVAPGVLGQPPPDLLDATVQRRTVPRRRGEEGVGAARRPPPPGMRASGTSPAQLITAIRQALGSDP